LRRDGKLQRVTSDHSVIEELMASGELTQEEADVDPRRSQITRALGLEPGVDVDLYPVQLQAGDRLLLCSDGLTGMVRDDALARVLDEEEEPRNAANRLVEMANEAGGNDNITCVVVDVVEDPEGGTAPVDDADAMDAAATEAIEDDVPATVPVVG